MDIGFVKGFVKGFANGKKRNGKSAKVVLGSQIFFFKEKEKEMEMEMEMEKLKDPTVQNR